MAGFKRERPTGSGNWELRAYAGLDPVTGKKLWRYGRFHGKPRAAQHALDELVAEVRAEAAPATEGTLAHLLTHWMRRVERDNSPDTAAGYWLIVDNLWMPRLGQVRLAKLTTTHLQAVVDDEAARVIKKGPHKDERVSPQTVERHFAVVRSALNEGVRLGWLARSPADNVVLPAKGYKEDRDPPTVAELAKILVAADNPALGVALQISAATGVRRGELCGLRWRDVDFERRRIMVRKSVAVKKRRKRKAGEVRAPAKRELIVKDTKTHQKRPVSIDQGTVELLEALKAHSEGLAEQHAGTGRLVRDAFVFSPEPDGSVPLRPPWVTEAFKAAAVAAGLPDVNLHLLRHLNASLQLAAGVPLAVVSKRLGHRNQTTTLNIYSHVVDGDGAAADLLGELLAPAMSPPEPEIGDAEVIELPDRRATGAG